MKTNDDVPTSERAAPMRGTNDDRPVDRQGEQSEVDAALHGLGHDTGDDVAWSRAPSASGQRSLIGRSAGEAERSAPPA
ncbi:hypothetical protein [Frondihabitans cladoniiphilus]|uniref:hypothetical protein n=1 Tax=Frondihabitans cladoniiphilus TaxID=715785 RepID=UPI0031E69D84